MKKELSARALKRDASRYKTISRKNQKNFKLWRHIEIGRLETKAYERLQDLDNGNMYIDGKNVKAWIAYVHAFAYKSYRGRFYEQLQAYADFDVKRYAEDLDLNWFEKVLAKLSKKEEDKPVYLNAKQMKKRIKEYKKAERLLNRDAWKYDYCHGDMEYLHDEGKIYAKNILNGTVTLQPEDYNLFPEYINVVCPYMETDGIREQAVEKVKQLAAAYQKNAVQAAAAPVPEKKTKQSKFGFWKKVKTAVKVAAATAVVILGGMFGSKSCESLQKHSEPVAKNITVTPKTDKPADVPVLSIQKDSVQSVAAPVLQTQKQADNAQVKEKSSEQKIWDNYYDNTVEILSSKAKKDSLYRTIEQQTDNKVFSLPDSISKERVIYTYLIYKAYGLRAPALEKAMQSKTKLSTTEQANMISEILAAGSKGQGAKQMAAKMNKGRLGNHSHFNHAPSHLQKQHIKTLKDLKQLKKMAHSR